MENHSLLGAKEVTVGANNWYEQKKGNLLIAGDEAWTSKRAKTSPIPALEVDLILSWVLPPRTPMHSQDDNKRKKSAVLYFETHSEFSILNKDCPQEK